MIDAVDDGLALGRQRGDDQRDRGAQIGRHDRRALEVGHARDHGGVVLKVNFGAETGELGHVHEAVFENRLGDARYAAGAGHQGHELGLKIGRKGGEGRGRHVHGGNAPAVARDPDALVGRRDARAGVFQHVERRLQQFGPRALQHHVAAGHGHGHGVGAGLDAVGQDRVTGAAEAGDALDLDRRRARALDSRPHLDETFGEIDDFGLAGGVADGRVAAREGGGH